MVSLFRLDPPQPVILCKLVMVGSGQLPSPQIQNVGYGSATNVWVEVEASVRGEEWVTYFIDTIGTLYPTQGYIPEKVDAGDMAQWTDNASTFAARLKCSYGDVERQHLEQVYSLSWEFNESYSGGWVIRELIAQPS